MQQVPINLVARSKYIQMNLLSACETPYELNINVMKLGLLEELLITRGDYFLRC